MKKQKRNELSQDFDKPKSKLNGVKSIAIAVGYVAFLIWAWYVLNGPKA